MRGFGLARLLALLGLSALLSCNGTTGYELVSFYAAGSGFQDATKGSPYRFDASGGVQVTLTQASLHLGALYLTQSVPQAGGGPQPCALPQTYEGAFVGEVRGDGDIDLLDPSVQEIHVTGDGSTIPAVGAQVWLTHASAITQGDLNEPDDAPILALQGSYVDATGTRTTFSGAITIDTTRIQTMNSALPGEIQICQERIVSGIPVSLTIAQSGTLVLQIDSGTLFNSVAFTDLPDATGVTSGCVQGASTERCFTNDSSNTSSRTLFANLTSIGPYHFAWLSSAP